jgi:ComF family protein
LKQTIQTFYRGLFNLVYPPECPYCEKPIIGSSSGQISSDFCESCKKIIKPELTERCSICDAPAGPHTNTEAGCYHCNRNRDRFQFDKVKSLGVYSNEIRSVCIHAKESSGRPVASAALNLLWEMWEPEISQIKHDLVLPVPFHRCDRFWRSHCSPETIAKALARKLKTKYSFRVLSKVKKTAKQSSLPVSRRRSNVRDAFRVNKFSAVHEKSVLLVDDIMTTGSTVNEISRCLKKAGAMHVSVVVLARALKGARSFVGE